MKFILKIVKGFLVGLGAILPGVSGGMIAASFNIYKDLITALNNFTRKPFKAVISIWEYLIGIAIGIGAGFILIATILQKFPIPITLLFVGLILGGIPEVYNDVKKENKKWYHYIVLIFAIVIMILVLMTVPKEISSIQGFKLYFVYIFIGLVMALSLIVPGLSGTMLLMSLGFYTYMTTEVSEFIKAVLTLDFPTIKTNIIPVFMMGMGGLIGLILLARIIQYILKKHPLSFNMFILGILLISPVNIMYTLYLENNEVFNTISLTTYIVGGILLILGVISGYALLKLGESKVDSYEGQETI